MTTEANTQQNMDLELTILMPCLNEAETLGTCIKKAMTFLEEQDIRGEVLIADNGSTDDSVRIATELGARVIKVAQKGYGAALIAGCQAAAGRYTIMGDSDDSYDFLDLMPFVEKLREGADLVMGNRFEGGIDEGAMPWSHRYIGNPILSGIGRVFYHSKINDFHCGLRGYHTARMQELNLKTTGMEYASEMVVKATLWNYRIEEVPTKLHKDGRSHAPHLNTMRDGWRHLKFLLMHCPNWLFLYPGSLLSVIGLVFMVILTRGKLYIGSAALDIQTLLYAAAFLLLGVNMILFARYTDTYARTTGFVPVDRVPFLSRVFSPRVNFFVGIILFILGVICSVFAVTIWSKASFDALDTELSMRLTIPAFTAITLGAELTLSGIFLGILEIKHR